MCHHPLISVIVPVFKVEMFIDRCLRSILSQNYENFELVLVDDGSPDLSGQICDEYAKNDSRIHVIHKNNGGLSDARNVGTKFCHGDYITFIDSDDWVAPNYLSELYRLISDNEADISICSFKKTDCEIFKQKLFSSCSVMTNIEALECMLYQKNITNSAWGKLYRNTLAKKFLFPNGKLYEDLFTTYKMFANSRKIVFSNSILYFYWKNPNSIMHHISPKILNEIEAVDEICLFIKQNYPQLEGASKSRKFSSYSQVYRWIKKSNELELSSIEVNKIWNYIKEYRLNMIMDSKARIKNRVAGILAYFGPKLYGKL